MVNGPVQGATLDPWPSAGWCGQPFYFLIFTHTYTHTHFPRRFAFLCACAHWLRGSSENIFGARRGSLITIISLPSTGNENNILFTRHQARRLRGRFSARWPVSAGRAGQSKTNIRNTPKSAFVRVYSVCKGVMHRRIN